MGTQNVLLEICKHGDVDGLRQFIENHRSRKDFTVFDPETGGSPLHVAVASDSIGCVKMLLSTKLVYTLSKDFSNRTCLDVAVENGASQEMIRLLTATDADLCLIGRNIRPLIVAIQQGSVEKLQEHVKRLNQLNYPFSNPVRFLEHMSLHIDKYKSNSAKIFEILVNLVVDISDGTFMQDISQILLTKCYYFLHESCIENWYLAEANEHRDLVRRLLENPTLGFDHFVIFGLHSGITSLTWYRYAALVGFTYGNRVLQNLLEVDTANSDVIDEVTAVLWPKIDDKLLVHEFQQLLMDSLDNRTVYTKLASTKWLDTMKLSSKFGDLLNDLLEPSLTELQDFDSTKVHILLSAYMPFSIEASADVHLANISEKLRKVECEIRHNINNNIRPNVRRCYFTQSYFKHTESEHQHAVLERQKFDREIAKYRGIYCAKSTLKSFCRTQIRKGLLETMGKHKSHSKLVENVRLLALPETLQHFLLYINS